jgi:rhomboid protease GluP
MTSSVPNSDALLRLCAAADPGSWFPSQYARETGIDRDRLDEPLNQLRIAGLVRIGGWEPGRGQCYVLTDAGRAAVGGGTARLRPSLGPVQPTSSPTPAGRMTAWDRGEAVRAAFRAEPARAPVLFAMVICQVIVFGLGVAIVLRDGAPLTMYFKDGVMPVRFGGQVIGASSPLAPLVLNVRGLVRGEWWQLLTYALVHYGLLHLAMNGYAHLAIGPLVERMYGSARFLALYVLSALGGGVAAALLSTEGASTAGSSGALCGLIGGFAAFILLNRVHLQGDLYERCRRWLANTLLILVLFSFLPGISWQGHLGGAVAGFISGVLLTYHRFGTAEQRWAALLGLVLLPIAGLAPLVEKGLLRLPRAVRAARITDSHGRANAGGSVGSSGVTQGERDPHPGNLARHYR